MSKRDLQRLADEDLMSIVEHKDPTAFEILYDRHGGAAYSLAYRIVGDRTAAAADHVVVVVADPALEAGRAAGRLDPPGQAGPGQRAEHVIHGLGRHRVQAGAHQLGDLFHVEVAAVGGENLEHGEPGARDAQPPGTQEILFRHAPITPRTLERFKFR